MSSNFGEYIKEIREKKGLSINQLAVKSGVSNAQISRIENGLRELPRPNTISKLAKGLDVPATELMEKAGYFEGLDEQKRDGVKNYFKLQGNLDERLEDLIKQAYGSKQEKKVLEAVNEFFGEDIIDYLDERTMEKFPTSYEGVMDFLVYCDLSLESKADFINFLHQKIYYEISESPSSYTAEKELFDNSLNLTDDEIKKKFSFKVDGRELTEEEYQRMIAAVRAERIFRESQK
jgi:transcriptional regulator with XRE-family HTH domain